MSNLYEKAQARVDRVEASISKQPVYHYPGQGYFYVFGFSKEGKKMCLGPYVYQSEAESILATLEDGEVFELKTRDLKKATANIKATLLGRGVEPDEALRKMLHSVPEEAKEEWTGEEVS
jgi:hypothetical protein